MRIMKVTQELSTARHQQTDGKTERVIRTVKQMLKAYLTYSGTNWVDLLPALEFNFNRTPNMSGISPYEIDMLRVLDAGELLAPYKKSKIRTYADRAYLDTLAKGFNEVAEIARNSLVQSQREQKSHYDANKVERTFQKGDLVL